MTDIRIRVERSVELEGRWDVAEDPFAAVVFCHPHPQHRGTMTAPLMHAVTAVLTARGFDVLRFNFRGVGASTGTWSGGTGEMDDVAAAVYYAEASRRELPLGIAGWSFGAATSLRWLARDGAAHPWAGIAPPVSSALTPDLPAPSDLRDFARTFILGDRDQFISVAELSDYADSVAGHLHVLQGSDHFFYFRESRVGNLVATALAP